jgi:hypothetical protein
VKQLAFDFYWWLYSPDDLERYCCVQVLAVTWLLLLWKYYLTGSVFDNGGEKGKPQGV